MQPKSFCSLQVYKVLLADSGTLLVCLTDSNGQLNLLRQNLADAFPGAPTRQTQIVHVSVLRVFPTQQFDTDTRQKLESICDTFTEKLKGVQVVATELW